MQSVGEKLKKARLEKNLSLDEVYRQTKIHTRVLEALEQDRAHNFLSHLYVKAFLKTYAQYLDLNAEELLKEYSDSQKIESSKSPLPPVKKKPKAPLKINPLMSFRLIAIIVLSFILISYLRFVINRITKSPQEAKTQKVRVKVMPAPAVVEDLVLEVRTKDSCWLDVKVDNQSIFKKILSKGKRERWQAKEKIEVRIGKPEALVIFVNGKPIDLKKVRVKKGLIVTHEGIVGK